MKKSIAKSLTSVVDDLFNDGAVDEITMREIHSLCLPDIQEYSAARIVELRKKTHLSQAAFAAVVNVSPSTVQKWETGNKHPTGTALKLLHLVQEKGLAFIA